MGGRAECHLLLYERLLICRHLLVILEHQALRFMRTPLLLHTQDLYRAGDTPG